MDHKAARALSSSILRRFPLVKQKHFDKIYHNDFEARDLPQLANCYAAYVSPQTYEVDSTTKLLRCVENYGQIVCHFTHPASETTLQRALSSFRVKLLEYLEVYTFQSVREWCFSFIATRIAEGADLPGGWIDGAPELQYKLFPLQSFDNEGSIEEY